jgi:opacity protein-like surface antigen
VLALASGGGAITLRPGLWYGPQKIRDAKIKSVYGEQGVFLPFLEVQLWKGLMAGGGYEFGYDREGKIGLDQLPTSLRMGGWDLFLGYEHRLNKFAVFAKAGLGFYSYKQTITGLDVAGYQVNHRKTTIPLAVGLKYYPTNFWFAAVEARYVPLKVKPFEAEVDLGGFRFMAGLGLAFDIR